LPPWVSAFRGIPPPQLASRDAAPLSRFPIMAELPARTAAPQGFGCEDWVHLSRDPPASIGFSTSRSSVRLMSRTNVFGDGSERLTSIRAVVLFEGSVMFELPVDPSPSHGSSRRVGWLPRVLPAVRCRTIGFMRNLFAVAQCRGPSSKTGHRTELSLKESTQPPAIVILTKLTVDPLSSFGSLAEYHPTSPRCTVP
jgi:hypothetical protein